MTDSLAAAKESLRRDAEILETEYDNGRGYLTSRIYHERRTVITEQWLKLAAIERGQNPYQPTHNGEPAR